MTIVKRVMTNLNLPRRRFLHLAAAAATMAVTPWIARAQAYPSRPVRIIVGFAPGGPTDVFARVMAQWLSDHLGQQFVVENRPGAGGNIATEMVVNAPPDGYTLLLTAPANTINTTLYDKLTFNFGRDIVPVASIVRTIYVMVVNPAIPAKTVPEFISYAKANPGRINMASAGSGTPQHVAGEQFKMMTGIDMVHVPYRGAAPALTDLIGGQVHVMFDNMTSSLEFIRAGKLRALAVTTSTRSALLPNIPTVGDFVPGFEASAQFGLGAPKNTPAEIVAKLNKEINTGLADPRIKQRFADLAAEVQPASPTEFGKLIADETEKWAKVVKFSGAKPD
jgi:tripartite-type tricarboxylate transporter receptor subunit TctC